MLNVSRRTHVILKGVYTFKQLNKDLSKFSKVVVDKIDNCRVVFKLMDLKIEDKIIEFPFYYSEDKIEVSKYIILLNCSYEFHYRYTDTADEVLTILQKMYTYANRRAKEESEKSIRNRKKK